MKPEILIGGHWLSAIMPWGDLEWVTCWPGGTETITFDVARWHRLFRPDAVVEVDYGGLRRAVGALIETGRGEPLTAEGLHRKAEDEPSLNGAGDATLLVGAAVDAAVVRGLPWTNDVYQASGVLDPPSGPSVALDPDQPHTIAQVLDQSALERGQHWGIDATTRKPVIGSWWATNLHMLPGLDGLGISRDGYASTITALYLDAATNTFKTVTRTDAVAAKRWGRVPRLESSPLAEAAAITKARAEEIVDGMLAQGVSRIGWTVPFEVRHGDVVNTHQQPVDLPTLSARRTIRLHGLVEDFADLSGRTRVDVPIARTRHSGDTVLIEPAGLSTPMADSLAPGAA